MKLHELRKPTRPILYALLLILTTTATLVFSLQTLLDGLMLDHARAEYAYVVTPYPYDSDEPLLEPVSQEVIDLLSDSEHVNGFQQQDIRAGKLYDTAIVPDCMMTQDGLAYRYVLEGTVVSVGSMTSSALPTGMVVDYFLLHLSPQEGFKSWCMWQPGSREGVFSVDFYRMEDEMVDEYGFPLLREGNHVLVVCDFFLEGGYVNTGMGIAYTEAARKALGMENDGLYQLFTLPEEYFVWKEKVDEEAYAMGFRGEVDWEQTLPRAEKYFLDQLDQAGLLPIYEKFRTLDGAVTVRYVSDMSLIPNMAKGTMYTDWGRQLQASDYGQNVCMVSQGLMQRNHLAVGDTITLAVAEDGYTIAEGREGAGWESGVPGFEDEFLPYGEPEEYTIVGFYHQLGRKNDDPSFLSIGDILIPRAQEDITGQTNRVYTLSFRVPGEGYDAFYAEVKAPLEALGYGMQIVDNGWEDVADSFYAMYDRRILTCICAVLCFLTAALSYGGLIFYHYRREYGLCRLQGAYKREAQGVFWKGFALSGLPGALIAIVASWVVYVLWLRRAVYEAIPLTMPSDPECLGLLGLWTLAELLIAVVLMEILIARSEKKGILPMI